MKPEITSGASLEDAIGKLEKTKDAQQQELSEKFHDKLESLKPGNLLRSSVARLNSKTSLKKKIVIGAGTVVSIYLLKKVLSRKWSGRLQLMIVSVIISAVIKKAMNNDGIPDAE